MAVRKPAKPKARAANPAVRRRRQPRRAGPVARALRAEFKELAKTAPDLAVSARAAAALTLARELDSTDVEGSAKASVGRALLRALDDIRGMAPTAEPKGDDLDELKRRRAARLERQRTAAR